MSAPVSPRVRTGLILLSIIIILSVYLFHTTPLIKENFANVFTNYDESPVWQQILFILAIIIIFILIVYSIYTSVSSQASALVSGVRNAGTGFREAGSGLGNWLRGKGESARANANVKRASMVRQPNNTI